MIHIKRENYQKMIAYAQAELPNEACGLLAGRKEGEEKYIETVYLLTNLDHSAEHFSIDPREQLKAVQDMRHAGYLLLGNWHSHPETPARPSEEDKRLAYDKEASYLIVSLMDREMPVVRSFLINGMAAELEELMIEEE